MTNMDNSTTLTQLETIKIQDISFNTVMTENSESSDQDSLSDSKQVKKKNREQSRNDLYKNSETSPEITNNPLTCQECGKEFKTEFWFKKHLLNHSLKQNLQCDLCGKIFKGSSILRAHKREIHSKINKYSCVQCSYMTNNKTNYEMHFAVRHTDVEKSGLKCDLCNESFHRKENIVLHKIKEHNFPRFKCDICDKSYTSKQYLSIHRAIHKSNFKLEHQCPVCGKLFINGGRLSSHMHRKHSGIQYNCEECGKKMSSPACLRDHMTQHTGVKLFNCDTCGKTFATRKYLIVHTRSHSGEKPYSCKQCDKTFTQKSSLTIHIRRYHEDVKPFHCSVCLKSFVTRTLLKNHMIGHAE